MSHERRIHARLAAHVPARLHVGSDAVEGKVENVGRGGVFFATEVLEVLVDEGAAVEVEFDVRRDGAPEVLRVPGTVLRSERYFDGHAVVRAFAIRFESEIDVDAFTIG